MSFPQLKAETLREHVLDVIRKGILDGKLQPGQRLIESKMAGEMGISRGPIREAINQLKKEGLVTVIPHKGTFVVKWSEEDVYEVYLLRSVLEGLAARKAAELFTDDDFAYLQSLLNRAKTLPVKGAVTQLSRLNLDFHEYICRRCGLPRLYDMWSVVDMQRRVFSMLTIIHSDRDKVIKNHQVLLDDLRKRDPEVAERSMRQHIMNAKRDLPGKGEQSGQERLVGP